VNSRALFRVLLVILVVLTGLTCASAGEPVRVDVLVDEGDRIVLDLTVQDYRVETVSIDGHDYLQLVLPGEPSSLEKGAPALPHVARSVIIPNDAAMSLRVIAAGYEEILGTVVPSKGPLQRTVDPATVPYEIGEVYAVDAFHPGPLASLGEPYIMRDHRGLVVRFHPFQHNPVTGVVRAYNRITVELTATGPGKTNVIGNVDFDRTPVKSFDDIYSSHFLNYDTGVDYPVVDEQGDMLIVAHDPWIGNLDAFVAHKASMGITATVVGVSTIGNDHASIKSYIQNVYDTSDLAFVLLVGDAAQVATPTVLVSGDVGASDPSYSKLAGDDNYPDVIVGRFSAGTAAELDTQTERTVSYETLPATSQDWFKRGTGIASSQGAGIGDEGQSDTQHMNEIRGWLLDDGYTEVDGIYDPTASDTQVTTAVNAGRGIINYTGHGSATSWGSSGFNNADVDALVNDGMLPFIFSVACVNGQFDDFGKCFAEAWLRATHNGVPSGAIGMYASSINQSWAPPMEAQDEFNLLLTDLTRPYRSFGALCYAASGAMMDAYGGDGVNMFNTWHVFGDPSLVMVGEAAQAEGLLVTPSDGLVATSEAGGACDPDQIVYTLRNLDETALEYEVVTGAPWVSVTGTGGSLAPGEAAEVTVHLNGAARNLDVGDYSDAVRFDNITNQDTSTIRPVSLSVGSPRLLHRWTLDGDPGWGLESDWEFGVPAGNGAVSGLNPDPTTGATGATVYGANLGGGISKFVGGPYYLTAGPLDFSQLHGVSITFQRWLNTYGPPDVLSTLDLSSDGTTWTHIWSAGSLVADAAWTPQTFDLSAADGSATAYVRWGYQVAQKTPKVGSGWNLDDVEIEGVPGTARITLHVDPVRVSWSAAPGAVGYDVIRGSVETLLGSAGDFTLATEECLADDVGDTFVDYSAEPPPGSGFWFLARCVGLDGPMTWQTLAGNQDGARDEEIAAAVGVCP